MRARPQPRQPPGKQLRHRYELEREFRSLGRLAYETEDYTFNTSLDGDLRPGWRFNLYGVAIDRTLTLDEFLDQVRRALDDDPGMELVLFLDRSEEFSDDAERVAAVLADLEGTTVALDVNKKRLLRWRGRPSDAGESIEPVEIEPGGPADEAGVVLVNWARTT